MVQTRIRDILAAHARLTVDVTTLADDSDLFDAGLTSLSTVNLLLAVEDEFDIEVPDHLLSTRTFQSIDALAGVVQSLRG
jgi:acyl carrier protein